MTERAMDLRYNDAGSEADLNMEIIRRVVEERMLPPDTEDVSEADVLIMEQLASKVGEVLTWLESVKPEL